MDHALAVLEVNARAQILNVAPGLADWRADWQMGSHFWARRGDGTWRSIERGCSEDPPPPVVVAPEKRRQAIHFHVGESDV